MKEVHNTQLEERWNLNRKELMKAFKMKHGRVENIAKRERRKKKKNELPIQLIILHNMYTTRTDKQARCCSLHKLVRGFHFDDPV